MIHIKRRYEELAKPKLTQVGTTVAEIKQQVREKDKRVEAFKRLAYYTFANRRLLNIYFEKEKQLTTLASVGGPKLDELSQLLRFSMVYPGDWKKAVDLVVKA